ncbi:MAG: TolC family protein [Terriglobia bacterium]
MRRKRYKSLKGILLGLVVLLGCHVTFASFAEEKRALTLQEAVALALERNQQALIARAQVDAMKGRIREVRSQALPQITIYSNALRLRDPSFLNASSFDAIPPDIREGLVPRGSNLFDYSIGVSQPLYTSGKVGTALKLASLENGGVATDQVRTEQDIRLRTIRAFYDLLLAEDRLGVTRETIQQRERQLELARSRYRAGVATEVDVLRSQVSLANAQPDLIRAENGVRQARSILNNLLVRPVDFPTQASGHLTFIPWTQADLQTIVQEAMAKRPELQRLKINEQESEMALRLAHAENGLRLDFNASYGLQARDPSNLTNRDFTRWNFSFNFTLPVFDGGKRSGLVEQALAQQRIARLTRTAQEDAVRLEAQTALDDLERAAKTIEAARLNVQQAERVLEMIQNNYKYGAATTLDVFDSQLALVLARQTLLQGLYDHTLARAQLRFVMGQDPVEPQEATDAKSTQ